MAIKIEGMTNTTIKYPKFMVLYGQPGVGKTPTLADCGWDPKNVQGWPKPLAEVMYEHNPKWTVEVMDMEELGGSKYINCVSKRITSHEAYKEFVLGRKLEIYENIINYLVEKGKLKEKVTVQQMIKAPAIKSLVQNTKVNATEEEENIFYPHRVGVLDNLTVFSEFMEKEATIKYKASSMGKTFEGENVMQSELQTKWLFHRDSVQYELFRQVMDIYPIVVAVAHVKDKKINQSEETLVTVKEMNLTGKLPDIIASKVDAVGHMYEDLTGKKKICFQAPTQSFTAKSRCPHLWAYNDIIDWEKIYFPK